MIPEKKLKKKLKTFLMNMQLLNRSIAVKVVIFSHNVISKAQPFFSVFDGGEIELSLFSFAFIANTLATSIIIFGKVIVTNTISYFDKVIFAETNSIE